jgi:hypothetical protein
VAVLFSRSRAFRLSAFVRLAGLSAFLGGGIDFTISFCRKHMIYDLDVLKAYRGAPGAGVPRARAKRARGSALGHPGRCHGPVRHSGSAPLTNNNRETSPPQDVRNSVMALFSFLAGVGVVLGVLLGVALGTENALRWPLGAGAGAFSGEQTLAAQCNLGGPKSQEPRGRWARWTRYITQTRQAEEHAVGL